MKRILSSDLTFTLKVLLPLGLIVVWLLSILNLYGNYWGGDSFLRFFAPLIIAYLIYDCWEFIRYKKVSVDAEFLYVSNYLSEARIPLSSLEEVAEQSWKGVTYPIDVSFKNPNEFGDIIRFMPKARFGHSLRDGSQVVDELRRLAGES